LFEDNTFIIRF